MAGNLYAKDKFARDVELIEDLPQAWSTSDGHAEQTSHT